jgi:hypothetical protein
MIVIPSLVIMQGRCPMLSYRYDEKNTPLIPSRTVLTPLILPAREAYFWIHHFLPPLPRLGTAVFSRSAAPKIALSTC